MLTQKASVYPGFILMSVFTSWHRKNTCYLRLQPHLLRYRVWMASLWCHVGILPRLQRVINSVIMYDPHASYQQSQSRNTCYVLILSNTCSSIYIPNRRSYGFTAYYNHPHLMQAILRTVAVWAVSTVAKYLQSQLACVIRCDIVGAVAWQHCTNPAVIGQDTIRRRRTTSNARCLLSHFIMFHLRPGIVNRRTWRISGEEGQDCNSRYHESVGRDRHLDQLPVTYESEYPVWQNQSNLPIVLTN